MRTTSMPTAAAGNFGDFGGGAEAGLEDQIDGFLIGEALSIVEISEDSFSTARAVERWQDRCRGRRRELR